MEEGRKVGGRKEGRKEGRNGWRKEGRNEGRKERKEMNGVARKGGEFWLRWQKCISFDNRTKCIPPLPPLSLPLPPSTSATNSTFLFTQCNRHHFALFFFSFLLFETVRSIYALFLIFYHLLSSILSFCHLLAIRCLIKLEFMMMIIMMISDDDDDDDSDGDDIVDGNNNERSFLNC
ncbi:unnamed protein product [Brugia timori]|uniref:Uncharacterized protein n=1 Tax=Brugia timori TaxID=42155 RepID=A0A0R3QC01_9BILA|nr:unnamed protein product [Brugia timori]